MTEKSEDQVKDYDKLVLENLKRDPLPSEIWVCSTSNQYFTATEITDYCCVGALVKYVPHTKYLALKSDLEKAVEALREIKECGSKTVPQTFPWYISRMIGIAKEALGKIGGGK